MRVCAAEIRVEILCGLPYLAYTGHGKLFSNRRLFAPLKEASSLPSFRVRPLPAMRLAFVNSNGGDARVPDAGLQSLRREVLALLR